jgi:hypothetical protein
MKFLVRFERGLDAAFCQTLRRGVLAGRWSFAAPEGIEAMHFSHRPPIPPAHPHNGQRLRVTQSVPHMATPPISSTHVPARSRRHRVARWLHARAAWLIADAIATVAAAALFIHALA